MHPDYRRIERAIEWIAAHTHEQPSLDDVARACGTSPHHFQRTFTRWAGVSPKRWLQILTIEHARKAILEGKSVLDATFDVGLSAPSRLHDLFVTLEAVTPGELSRRGRELVIRHGLHETPFGPARIATTERGVCHFSFQTGEEALRERFPDATFLRDTAGIAEVGEQIFERTGPVALLVEGTNFQVQVFRALLAIPEGSVASYEAVARSIGRPKSARAVAATIARNEIALLLPCHRVLRKSGALSGYRWGGARKQAILAWEGARTS